MPQQRRVVVDVLYAVVFIDTSDVEQIGLELSPGSVQCHLWSV